MCSDFLCNFGMKNKLNEKKRVRLLQETWTNSWSFRTGHPGFDCLVQQTAVTQSCLRVQEYVATKVTLNVTENLTLSELCRSSHVLYKFPETITSNGKRLFANAVTVGGERNQ
jgi:hypothetical protein